MPIGPMGALAIGTGASALNKILMRKPKPGMVDPRTYKDDVVISGGDLATARSNILRGSMRASLPAIATARREGASQRLPMGMMESALQGIGYRTAEGAGRAEPGLLEAQRKSRLDYQNLLNQFLGRKEETARIDAGRFNLTSEIGLLTKAFMLYKAGLITPQGQGQGVGAGPDLSYGGGGTGSAGQTVNPGGIAPLASPSGAIGGGGVASPAPAGGGFGSTQAMAPRAPTTPSGPFASSSNFIKPTF